MSVGIAVHNFGVNRPEFPARVIRSVMEFGYNQEVETTSYHKHLRFHKTSLIQIYSHEATTTGPFRKMAIRLCKVP